LFQFAVAEYPAGDCYLGDVAVLAGPIGRSRWLTHIAGHRDVLRGYLEAVAPAAVRHREGSSSRSQREMCSVLGPTRKRPPELA
jgi:hypothetical protein